LSASAEVFVLRNQSALLTNILHRIANANTNNIYIMRVLYHRLTVITATSVSYGKMETLNPCKIETLEQIDTQFVTIDYAHVCSKFGKNQFTGTSGQRGEI